MTTKSKPRKAPALKAKVPISPAAPMADAAIDRTNELGRDKLQEAQWRNVGCY
jgi:hypothetical protein